eukprot:scaffold910_cov111-Skeletonema_marinoi.AAC.3
MSTNNDEAAKDDPPKKSSGGWGFNSLKEMADKAKEMGNQVEETMRAKQAAAALAAQQQQEEEAQQQQQQQQGGGGLGGNLMSRIQFAAASGKLNGSVHGTTTTEQPSPQQLPPTTPTRPTETTTTTTNPSTPKTNPITTPLSARSPEDVSKEELLEILKKMNTRVKSLSQSRLQLAEKVKQSDTERERLVQLLRREVLDEVDYEEARKKMVDALQNAKEGIDDGNGSNNGPDEVLILQMAWRASDERHQLNLQHIQNEYKVMTMQSQAELEKVRKKVMEEKDVEIARMKEDMREALENVSRDGGFATPPASLDDGGGVVGGDNEVVKEKEEEIQKLKEENHSLKAKFKGHLEKVGQFKERVAVELKNAREEAAKSTKEAEDAKIALEQNATELKEAAATGVPPEVLAEKDERIRELETSLAELQPLHTAELERAKEELKQQNEEKLQSALEVELQTANEKFQLELEEAKINAAEEHKEAMEKLRVELAHAAEEQLSEAIMTAKMEAINSNSAELTSSLESAHTAAMAQLQQSHEEERNNLIEKYTAEIGEMQSNNQVDLESIRSEEAAKYAGEMEKLREEEQSKYSEELERLRHDLESSAASDIEHVRAEAEEERVSAVDEALTQLKEGHVAEIENVKSEMMAMANSSQSEQLEQLAASNAERVEQLM